MASWRTNAENHKMISIRARQGPIKSSSQRTMAQGKIRLSNATPTIFKENRKAQTDELKERETKDIYDTGQLEAGVPF